MINRERNFGLLWFQPMIGQLLFGVNDDLIGLIVKINYFEYKNKNCAQLTVLKNATIIRLGYNLPE